MLVIDVEARCWSPHKLYVTGHKNSLTLMGYHTQGETHSSTVLEQNFQNKRKSSPENVSVFRVTVDTSDCYSFGEYNYLGFSAKYFQFKLTFLSDFSQYFWAFNVY